MGFPKLDGQFLVEGLQLIEIRHKFTETVVLYNINTQCRF